MRMYKKLLITLVSVFTIATAQAAAAQAQVAIFARLFDRDIVSWNRYIVGVDKVARFKHFESGVILEGSIDAITFDRCTVTVKKMRREGTPYGGEFGFSKIYKIIDQFQITLKKGQSQGLRLSDNQYLELTFEA